MQDKQTASVDRAGYVVDTQKAVREVHLAADAHSIPPQLDYPKGHLAHVWSAVRLLQADAAEWGHFDFAVGAFDLSSDAPSYLARDVRPAPP